jgi:hypothetical protein
VPAWVDGREVVGVFRDCRNPRLDYFVELTARDGAITLIKAYRYVPYINVDAAIEIASVVGGGRPPERAQHFCRNTPERLASPSPWRGGRKPHSSWSTASIPLATRRASSGQSTLCAFRFFTHPRKGQIARPTNAHEAPEREEKMGLGL